MQLRAYQQREEFVDENGEWAHGRNNFDWAAHAVSTARAAERAAVNESYRDIYLSADQIEWMDQHMDQMSDAIRRYPRLEPY